MSKTEIWSSRGCTSKSNKPTVLKNNNVIKNENVNSSVRFQKNIPRESMRRYKKLRSESIVELSNSSDLESVRRSGIVIFKIYNHRWVKNIRHFRDLLINFCLQRRYNPIYANDFSHYSTVTY